MGCCPPVVLLKYHHYIYKTNFVTHVATNYLFRISTVLLIHYLSLRVGCLPGVMLTGENGGADGTGNLIVH